MTSIIFSVRRILLTRIHEILILLDPTMCDFRCYLHNTSYVTQRLIVDDALLLDVNTISMRQNIPIPR